MPKELYDRIDEAERKGNSLKLTSIELKLVKCALWSANVDDQRTFEDAVFNGGKNICGCGHAMMGASGLCDKCFLKRESSVRSRI